MRHVRLKTLVFLAFTCIAVRCGATESHLGSGDSVSDRGNGIYFAFGSGPYLSTLSESRAGTYDLFLGIGYGFLSRFALGLKVYTGAENIDADSTKPVSGSLSLGGVAAEFKFYFIDRGLVRPFTNVGYDVFTILIAGGNGYNGTGYHVGLGTDFYLADYFSIGLAAVYRDVRYADLVDASGVRGFANPFTDSSLRLAITISFHSNGLP